MMHDREWRDEAEARKRRRGEVEAREREGETNALLKPVLPQSDENPQVRRSGADAGTL
ncbi:hypothetical protein RchiOBHm_Chr2g0088871 [Rosa chinensis]|uniref:Uncharacterized protein n=1 Tax=Rosa chinensis TaxID=74649 RepID=A0A2P6RJ27_ROSCH|nr:hypothetical protein RchiOBHm_Chr2g0088871 [Rosa chinensis]